MLFGFAAGHLTWNQPTSFAVIWRWFSGVISVTIGDGFKARLEFVLEQVFKNHSDGGDHERRAFVARRLLQAAQRGVLSLEKLKSVAQEALLEAFRSSKSA